MPYSPQQRNDSQLFSVPSCKIAKARPGTLHRQVVRTQHKRHLRKVFNQIFFLKDTIPAGDAIDPHFFKITGMLLTQSARTGCRIGVCNDKIRPIAPLNLRNILFNCPYTGFAGNRSYIKYSHGSSRFFTCNCVFFKAKRSIILEHFLASFLFPNIV